MGQLTFEEARQYLERLGCDPHVSTEYRGEPGPERHSVELPKFHSLNPNFSADQWMHLTSMAGGDYIGGCCGQMSAMQDTLNHWYRHYPFSIPLSELAEVAESMNHHHGNSDPYFSTPPWEMKEFQDRKWTGWADAVEGLSEIWNTLRPLLLLGILHQLTTDFWVPRPPSSHSYLSPIDRALRQIENCASVLSLHGLFSTGDWTSQDKLWRAQQLAKLTPALKTLNEHLQELDLGGFEGWALIDMEKGKDAICANGYGLCLYATEEEITHILDSWRKDNTRRTDPACRGVERKIGIRPVRVSFELSEGYEFTGPVARVEKVLNT